MKKLKLFLLALTSLIICNAQNPQWINYTNGNNIAAIAEEGDYLWIATHRGGLVKLHKASGNPVFFNKANSGLPNNWVRSIAIDLNNNKWIWICVLFITIVRKK